jgi:hypothetical protein
MGVSVKTYRKVVPIEAVKWDLTPESTQFIVDWAACYGVEIDLMIGSPMMLSNLRIPTLEGPMYASVGDYIAKGINNEFWAIKPDIMEKTYEEV